MKKIFKNVACVGLAALSALSVTACGINRGDGQEEVIAKDPTIINVRIIKAGNGTSYMYKLKEKFEAIYAEEGYKVNVLVPLSGLGGSYVYESIYNNDGVDMYFVGQDIQRGVVGEYGQVLADITENVYEQKPIRFDGTEEDTTVAAKIEGLQYDNKYNGRYYGLPYTFTIFGLAVNTKAMANYEGMEIPRTSNEYFDCVETIMSKAKETGIFPYTYSLQSNNQPMMMFQYWQAQLAGYDELQEFWTMQDSETGENLANPYEVFNTYSFKEATKDMFRVMDYNTPAFGASTQDFKAAQNQWMNGDAVFYNVGAWAYNEEKVRNQNKLNDIAFARVPVHSALGTLFFGTDTAYGYSDEKCEEILCAIIDGVDANKEIETIVSEVNSALNVNLQQADVLEVAKRIGFIVGNSDIETAIISEKSTKKDICALFLRMCASDDGASLIAHEMLTANPFNLEALNDVDTKWHQGYTSLIFNRYRGQFPQYASGYRRDMGLTTLNPLTGDRMHTKILEYNVSIFNDYTYQKEGSYSEYYENAADLLAKIYNNAKTQWESGLWN